MEALTEAVEAGKVREIGFSEWTLEQIQAALDPAQFVPGEATRSFNLAMTDYAASLILPRLAEHLGATAPGIDIRVRVNTIVNAPAMLDAGEIDFAVGGAPDAPSRFGRFALMEDGYVCVMRRGHPLAGPSLALPDYIAARHLLITLTGDATGIVDRLLEPMGLRRRVAMTCNQFQVAPLIIRSSDLIVTLPRRIAETSAMVDELHIVPVPLPVPPIKVMLLWHDRLGNHPAQEWMQAVLAEICRTL
jgi:DNA-binding transcriptional LysR family regulator